MAWSAPDLEYLDIVKWAMPVFILMAVLEFLVSVAMKKRVYYLHQVWSNIAGGGTSFLVLGTHTWTVQPPWVAPSQWGRVPHVSQLPGLLVRRNNGYCMLGDSDFVLDSDLRDLEGLRG